MPVRDLLIALGVVTVWGFNFVVIKWGVAEMPPLLLTALRYVAAALPAVFFVRLPKVGLASLVLYGLSIGVMQFGLLFSAIKLGMPAGLASLIIQMQAFFTIALAALFLGERPGPFQVLGAVVSFGGIALIAVERIAGAELGTGQVAPLLMVLAGAVFWGMGNIVSKRAGPVDMLAFVVWASLVPPLPLLAASWLFEGPDAIVHAMTHISWSMLGVIAFNGYAATIFGFGMWAVLLSRHKAGVVAPFSLLVPVVGLISAWLLAGEPLGGWELAGSALVLAGLAVNGLGPRLWHRIRPRGPMGADGPQ